jgi:hypothetical protein
MVFVAVIPDKVVFSLTMTTSCILAPYTFIGSCQRFEGTHCLHLKLDRVIHGSSSVSTAGLSLGFCNVPLQTCVWDVVSLCRGFSCRCILYRVIPFFLPVYHECLTFHYTGQRSYHKNVWPDETGPFQCKVCWRGSYRSHPVICWCGMLYVRLSKISDTKIW